MRSFPFLGKSVATFAMPPDSRTLEVFALSGDKWLIAATFKNADPVTAAPFEAHTFALDGLWEV